MGRRSLFAEQRWAEAFVNLDGTEHAWILYDRAPARICLSRFAFGETRILPAEGVNNKIRVLQRCAYGLRDEEYLRLKILTCMLPAI